MTKKIKVILLDNVKGIGNKGQLIEASVPYVQNVLIPKKLAKIADTSTVNDIKQKEESVKKHHADELKAVKDLIDAINSKGGLKIARQATTMNHLYDKIDEKDISKEILMTYKVKLSDKNFKLSSKIESLGDYTADFHYEDIKSKIQIIVERK